MASLNAVHILLSYRCTNACRHCFVFAGPNQTATFNQNRLYAYLDQIREVPSVRWVYFEGGEPFLYQALLNDAVDHASRLGLATCVVTNGYWVTSDHDLGLYLRPLVAAGLKKIQFSVDELHRDHHLEALKPRIAAACREMRLTCQFIGVTVKPTTDEPTEARRGKPVLGGTVAFRGRAAEQLTGDQALWDWASFDECPHELLDDPLRVHIDPHGYVHACQGILIGSLNERRLEDLLADYDPWEHPIIGPLLRGGPAGIAMEYDLAPEEGYADACHLCYSSRKKLRERFPDALGPAPVYGVLEPDSG